MPISEKGRFTSREAYGGDSDDGDDDERGVKFLKQVTPAFTNILIYSFQRATINAIRCPRIIDCFTRIL